MNNATYENLGTIGCEFRHEQRPAVIDLWDPEHPREASYPEFHDACDAIARGLVKRGFKPGDHLGMLCSNRLEFLEIFFGAMRAGIIPIPIGIVMPKATIEWIIRDARIGLVICDGALRGHLPADVPCVDIDADGQAEYRALKDPGPFDPFVPGHDDVAFQPYTSGSTGRPKGVMLSHRAHTWVARSISQDRGFNPKDRMIVAAPLYHKHAMNSIKCVLVGGSAVILMRKFDPRAYIEAANRYGATVLSGVPTIFAMMLQQRDLIGNHDYSHVRLCTMGGAPASDVLIDSVAETFPRAEIVTIYGATETSASLFGPHPEGRERPRHSVGWPVKGNEFRLVDGESEDFGTLYVKGPGMMNGYYNNPAEMARRLKDGWFDTGDVLRRDAEGWYYFVGRADDMFVCSGNNIYPGDVELMLERHEDIDQAIVVPVPDEIKHRIPYAFVVKRAGSPLDEKAVQQYALENAPPYQYPRRVIFLDALPLNGVGKIDRKALEARAKEISVSTNSAVGA